MLIDKLATCGEFVCFTLSLSMRFDIITLFPEVFEPYLSTSILGRARSAEHVVFSVHALRDFALDKHRVVDDTPYGGGPGMVLKVEPIDRALAAIGGRERGDTGRTRTVVLSARGEQFTQQKAQEYAALDQLILICGRYEGIDQRVVDHLADEELSIGPYVLAGGEAAAMVVVEAVTRLIPGVLGNPASLSEESFATTYNPQPTTSLEYPQYTKPATYKGWTVPDILLSGDHAAIRRWRLEQGKNA